MQRRTLDPLYGWEVGQQMWIGGVCPVPIINVIDERVGARKRQLILVDMFMDGCPVWVRTMFKDQMEEQYVTIWKDI